MSKKILIVDDDNDFVQMNKSILEAQNYQVITSNNPREGLDMIRTEVPDLLLLDVMMGSDVAGFDAVEEIRKTISGRKLPILMITSFADHHKTPWEDKPDRNWVDVDNYLQKPVSPQKLVNEVEKLLSD